MTNIYVILFYQKPLLLSSCMWTGLLLLLVYLITDWGIFSRGIYLFISNYTWIPRNPISSIMYFFFFWQTWYGTSCICYNNRTINVWFDVQQHTLEVWEYCIDAGFTCFQWFLQLQLWLCTFWWFTVQKGKNAAKPTQFSSLNHMYICRHYFIMNRHTRVPAGRYF